MIFKKAYIELLDGKRIRRKEWEPLLHLKLVDKKVTAFRGETTLFSGNCDVLNSHQWKVVGGDQTRLSFVEALEELSQQRFITREGWGENEYLFIDRDQFAVCKPVEFEFMPTFKCLRAQDWEVMK